MKKTRKTPYFEVDFKQRLEQSQTATNAVRLPRLGFQQYRVYDIEKPKKESAVPNGLYGINGQQIGRGIRKGPINIVTSSYNSGHPIFWIVDEWFGPSYTVRWLKPKHVTFLQLKGHRVEEVNRPE